MANSYNSSFTGLHNDEYDIRITALNNDKLSKTGGDLSGNLNVKDSLLTLFTTNQTNNTTPSTMTDANAKYLLRDSSESILGRWFMRYETNGNQSMMFETARLMSDGYHWNSMALGVNSSGTQYVGVSHPNAWLHALLLTPVAVSPTAGANVNIAGEYQKCYKIGYICVLNLNVQVNAALASGSVLMSGLPRAIGNSAGCMVMTNGAMARVAVTTDGNLVCDGAISATGWYDDQVIYVMASL